MAKRYSSILETIGHTPVVRINRLASTGVNLFVKIEAFNPLGSIKDRLAIGVIEAAENSGALKPGQTVLEATSGNTGIGLAMVCAAKGYPLVLIMAEPFSVERRKLMRFLGAKVVITPAAERAVGMIKKMEELAAAHGWYMTRQFENEANPEYHSRTTAREIIDDFADVKLDYWVTGYGTGGTLKGVARVLRKESPGTKIIVCEPEEAPLLGSKVEQARKADGTPAAPHPSFKPHPMQGWTPDFIPKLTDDAVAMKIIDRILPISGTKIIVCEPEEAPLLGSKVEQARNADGTPAAPHPSFKPHPMQGWTPDFIPKLTSDAVDMKVIDRLLQIPGPQAIRCSKDLAAKEGIFVGITSGATFAGALKVAAEADKGANILCMLPDTGERYLSTPLFADVPADMTW